MRNIAILSAMAMFCVVQLAAQAGRGNQGSYRASSLNTVYLNGQVALEDGSPPPDLVSIERVCRGQVFPEGLSEPSGKFSVRVGSDATSALGDASTYGTDSRGRASGDTLREGGISGSSERFSSMKGQGSMDLTGCELRASLDGFRSDSVPLTRRNIFDNPDVGTIILHPLGGSVSGAISATTLQAPKDAKKFYDRARKETSKPGGKLDKAVQDLEKAVGEHPQYAAAWSLLAKVKLGMGDEAGALEGYAKAIESDPGYLAPYPPAIKLAVRAGDWQGVIDLADAYLKLDPSAAEERFYHAMANINLAHNDEAERQLDLILADERQAKAYPQARHLKGVILGQKGQFSAAADTFRQFLADAPDSPAVPEVERQLNEWKALGVIE